MLTPAMPGIAEINFLCEYCKTFLCNKTMNNIPSHHFFVKTFLFFRHMASLKTFPVVHLVQYHTSQIDTFPQRADTRMTNVLFYRIVAFLPVLPRPSGRRKTQKPDTQPPGCEGMAEALRKNPRENTGLSRGFP